MSHATPNAAAGRAEDHGAPWNRAFSMAGPHGVLVGIHLPVDGAPPSDAVLSRLHPRERANSATLTGRRLVEWVGGRLALQHALKRLHARRQPFLAEASGGVQAPSPFAASVSHKRDLAVGLLAPAATGHIGVDVECLQPARCHLASRLLTADEISAWEAMPQARRWPALLLAFSIKESVYKAIYPLVQRYVGFHEVEIGLHPDGTAAVRCAFEGPEGPLEVDARYTWRAHHLVTSARLRLPRVRGA